MIQIRKADDRGRTELDWLDSKHTFSFGEYYDPQNMGFRALRVINDDRVAAGQGFGMHPHRDMEIVTYIVDGALEHKDSLGTGSVVRPGDLQRMTAGTGVLHSEFNPSKTSPVHLLQIWIVPEKRALKPSYEQKSFSEAERRGRLRLLASRDGRDGALTVHQDVEVYGGLLDAGEAATHELRPGRHAWLHVARGEVRLGDRVLREGDGAAIDGEPVALRGEKAGEVLLFDLA